MRVSRAALLLQKLVALGVVTEEQLATELVVPLPVLRAFADASRVIPLDRQLCLALYIINNVPALAREGHGLRGQVESAIRVESAKGPRSTAASPVIRIAEQSRELTDSLRDRLHRAVRVARATTIEPRTLKELEEEVARYARALRASGRTAEQVLLEMKRLSALELEGLPLDVKRPLSAQLVTWSIEAFYDGSGTPA
jgi:hypothetical protein